MEPSLEDYITLREAGDRIGVTRPSVWRWYQHGIRGVHLQARWVGGTLRTTEQWLHEFFEATTREALCRSRSRRPSKPTVVAHDLAEARLAAEGM